MILLLACRTGYAASPAWITVAERAAITGRDILLGDIAQIRCGDSARTARLASLKLGNAPPPGGEIELTRQEFGQRLSLAGGSYEDISWFIPQAVTIETKAQAVSGAGLTAAAQSYIEDKMKAEYPGQRYTLETLYMPRDVAVPEGEAEFRVELPNGVKLNGPMNAVVRIYVDGRLYKSAQSRFKLRVYERVVVANRSLASRETISAADVSLEDLDTSKIAPGYLTDLRSAIGMVTKRVVSKGAVLSSAMLDKPVLIKRMTTVEIRVVIGDVEVKMEGQAMQDGRESQMIRVKNTKTGRVVMGKVIDDSTVEVSTH